MLLQTDIFWGYPAANRMEAERLIFNNPKADLYILPEMFATGFSTEPMNSGSDTVEWMQKTARKCGGALCGSLSVRERGKWYNRFYFVTPQAEIYKYDKRHLFSYAGEDRSFTAGRQRVVVAYNGWRFLLQICYDLRFPVFSRNTLSDPYDAIIYVASWPSSRINVWDTLLQARAIENQAYVLAVNRIGKDPQCNYCGHTSAYDFKGNLLGVANQFIPSVLCVNLQKEDLDAFRQQFPALADADSYTIHQKIHSQNEHRI